MVGCAVYFTKSESIMSVTMLAVTEFIVMAIMALLMVAINAVLVVILMVVFIKAIMVVVTTTMIPQNIRLTVALPRCSESKWGDEKTADVLHALPDPRARKGVPL